ncbi:MAG: Ger(x)C family spore germination protein [Bacilli bacterium]|nr:Ger(x)C family spore germination protein [Bacilli bacterium]
MKKIILILLIFFLTGCTDYKELTDMAIVTNVAIDYKDDYKLIIQVLDNKENNNNVIIYESNGNTLEEAFRNISLECPKKLYLGHIQTFIVKDDVFKINASKFIDFILRNHEIEKDFNLLVTSNDIKDIMSIKTELINIPSESISKGITNSSVVKGISNIYFDNYLMILYDVGIDPVLPTIKIKDNNIVLNDELAIFRKDKLVSYLDKDSSFGYSILNDKASKSIITFKCDSNNYSSIEILSTKSNYKYINNSLIINLNLTATLKELNCNIDITNDNGINKLKNMFIDEIKRIINKTIDDEKKLNSDYLGIGRYLYKNDYNFYISNNMNNVIKNMNSKIIVDVTFTQKSSIKKGDEKY